MGRGGSGLLSARWTSFGIAEYAAATAAAPAMNLRRVNIEENLAQIREELPNIVYQH